MNDLHHFILRYPRLFVLSGAGVSTDSGIPGYRDAEGRWTRTPPIVLQDFLRHPSARQRYWARSKVGWRIVTDARPNAAHYGLVRLEAAGRLQRLVTQNVDGLHQRAGSTDVIELHGNLGRVRCVDCGADHSRESVQRTLEAENPGFTRADGPVAPDGDADVEAYDIGAFRVPACARCGGILKPDVVFFGEGVPKHRVDAALRALERSDAVLVIGSSLMVYSGYRFCEWAHKMGKPIAAINLGQTRADHLLSLKIAQSCADALGALIEELCIAERGPSSPLGLS